MRVTSRDYARPRRRWAVRALDRLAPRADLSVGSLVDAARAAEGLRELGPPDLDEPLGRLCEAIDAEAALTRTGSWLTRIRLVGLLRSRLRLHALGVRDGDVAPPVVVTGLQRTGTTLLHRLLAADPRARSVRSWEALDPAPHRDGADRLAATRRSAAALQWLAPDFFAVHPIDPEATEEEVVLLGHTFLSTVDEAILRVPSYAAWVETQDQAPAYAWLRRALRALERQRRGDWWVLKTPHHLEWLDTLLAVFPTARVVWTHRDPRRTMASFCSMVAHGRGVFSNAVDPRAIGQEWLRKCERMVGRAAASRSRAPERFFDVDYAALMADPEAVVASVYAWAGLPWDDVARRAVRAAREVHVAERFGRHVYDLADFGLTEDEVATRLAGA